MKSLYAIIGLILLCLLLSPALAVSNPSEPKKRVLVIHSYHQGFHWTDRIMAGIQSVFDSKNVELYTTYMDTKRHSSPAYFYQLKTLYQTKYAKVKFDAIISTDDHALDFLITFKDEIFPGIPIIFSGLNAYSENRLQGKSNITGIYESYDVVGTIQLMLKLHPETRLITTISDETRSGKIFATLIEKAKPKFRQQVSFNHISNLNPQELKTRLANLPDNSLVLWAIYLRLPSGATFSSQESVDFISTHSHVPVYCIWDVVGQGVVGGKITSPNYQGIVAATTAWSIINGESINNIPVLGGPLNNIFDYNQLQRFNISLDSLPLDSIVLNQPNSFYQQYQKYIFTYTLVIMLLTIAIIFLVVIIFLRRKRDEFKGLAMHDQLTGLYNRYYLQESTSLLIYQAIRHDFKLSLLVLDLDHFKKINDTHGHLTGDIILKEIAKCINEGIRGEDIVARIGGEEFVILFNRCDKQIAAQKAEQLRQKVARLKPRDLNVTVSIGITELKPQDSLLDLLSRADLALYSAKNQGRNCVVIN
ncbi:diguanylate cyclase [Aliikangiella sp. IMCC44653]